MDVLQKLVMGAGQKVHENLFGAVFTWNGNDYPCTHGEIMRNPPLITGGFSPNTEVEIAVRDELFGAADQPRPAKGHKCILTIADATVFNLQIGTVMTTTGDVLQKFLCSDSNQGA